MKNYLLAISLVLLTQTACSDNVVHKTEEPHIYTTSYTVTAPSCDIIWAVRRAPEFARGFSFSERSKCDLPLPQQKALRLALLDSLIVDTNNLADVRGFGWGQIQRGDATDEFAQRMQQLAKAKNWHALIKAGKKATDPYLLLEQILNQGQVFAELQEVFTSRGFSLQVRGIETIQLSKEGLPANCDIRFAVKKSHGKVD